MQKDWLSPLFDQKIDRKGKDSAKPEWEKSDVSKYTADAVRKAPNITRNLMSVKKGF